MNLVVWNINRSSLKRFKRQMAVLAAYRPDILALTEVGIKAGPRARDVLGPLGYEHVVCSQDLLDEDERMTSSGVLFASRYPFEAMAHGELGVPIKHRALSAVFETPRGEVEGHVVHVVPGSSYGWKKVEFFEAIYERLAREHDGPRFLCGDFNSPRLEESDGSVRVFGHRKDPRWAQAERSVITGLADFGLGDAYRGVHGYEKFGWSHQLVRKGRLRWQRRFDHVFACPTLEAIGATYLHDLDEYSDHSPLEIRFVPGVSP